ncbi:MAG TPA: hypothetical protein DDW45_02435 [Gammaproteobacteria bacterium]|nr:hypothetical protein [Gammaproteobacteria bacterium]
MSDIFLSYTSEDRDRLRPLVKALEDQGWSVFWDRKIPVGQTWRDVIGREIRDCLGIVVVWSQASVQSQWVMEESEEGKRRRILFPVTVDGATPPFGFGSIQSADFTDWEGGTDHPGYKLLIGDLTRHIQGIKDQREAEYSAKELTEQQKREEREREERGGATKAERKVNAGRERQTRLQAEKLAEEQEEAAKQQLVEEEVRKYGSETEPHQNVEKLVGKATGSELTKAEPVIRKPLLFGLGLIGLTTLLAAAIYWFNMNPIRKNIEITDDMLPEMVLIPPGSFTMGCVSGINCNEDELPTRRVTVPAFKMSKFEVTFRQWDACHADGGCTQNPDDQGWGRDDRPVINVSWNDAVAYAEWLSDRTGLKKPHRYRLPSEAEWEYAARAGTTTNYWWGDEFDQNGKVWANCAGCASKWDSSRTAPAGSFKRNPFDLYDTSGNVSEWGRDCFIDSYEGAPEDATPLETAEDGVCSGRVLRGGSWDHDPQYLRSASRFGDRPDSRNNDIGFRLARTP